MWNPLPESRHQLHSLWPQELLKRWVLNQLFSVFQALHAVHAILQRFARMELGSALCCRGPASPVKKVNQLLFVSRRGERKTIHLLFYPQGAQGMGRYWVLHPERQEQEIQTGHKMLQGKAQPTDLLSARESLLCWRARSAKGKGVHGQEGQTCAVPCNTVLRRSLVLLTAQKFLTLSPAETCKGCFPSEQPGQWELLWL